MKKIRIGVFGAGRGAGLAKDFMLSGCEIVAICDFNKERRDQALAKLGTDIAVYEDFDSFIEHDMDAVILANYFHEHAPYAIKCFEKGIHVYSECISNGTMAEGVELIRAFEKSNSIYLLAENYPQMTFNKEMQKVCKNGTLGKILYAEGEYNHPSNPYDTSFQKTYVYFEGHWRNYAPRTYYITHSLGPVMRATGATPKKVTAYSIFAPIEGDVPTARRDGDRASIITTLNDDGSVFRITGCAAFGAHSNSYRICGTKGQIENLRGMGDKVMLRYNDWDIPEGMQEINLYTPELSDEDAELVKLSGHGGSDFFTVKMFVDCIKENKQPEHPFDVYSAVNMSSVAILAHRSVLDGGKPYDIPDFHLEENRKLYENDRLSPFPGKDGSAPTLPCSSHPDFSPTEKQMQLQEELLNS